MQLDTIKKLGEEISSEVIGNRRHLHAYPELSFQEFQTSAFVKNQLDSIGIEWKPMADTGVVGIIQGEKSSDKIVALRADMDALPITESNDVIYKSNNEGVMHACGHDAHTASLLGTAKMLQSLRPHFGGTVKLIFQPAEEKLPGGASLMIKDGVLENPTPQAVIGQHVMPSLECGKLAVRSGKQMASMDEIFITVYGKGGHGAQPHRTIDPVMIAANIITMLQQVTSRMSDPTTPTVLSIGKVIANGAINVIPDEVYMEGTFRTFDDTWRKRAHVEIEKIAKNVAETAGARCEVKISYGYPVLKNDMKLTTLVTAAAEEYLGKENVVDAGLWMAAEDFAYYSQRQNSCFYFLGVGNEEKNINSGLHTPTFNIDERALATSTGLMTYIALKQLGNHFS